MVRSNGVAQPGAREAAADAEAAAATAPRPRSGRNPGWRPCLPKPPAAGARLMQRVGRLVEQLDRLGSTAGEARPRRGPVRRGSGGSRCRCAPICSICSATSASGSAPNWRDFALQRVRRDDQRDRVLLVHRLLDRGEALGAVLAEIAEDADEARAKLGPALLEMHPVDDVRCRRPLASMLPCAPGPGAVPPALPNPPKGKGPVILRSLVVERILRSRASSGAAAPARARGRAASN